METADKVAEQAKNDAEEFNNMANEIRDATAGDWKVYLLVGFAGLLLAVAVFTNLYSTIKGPPPKKRSLII